MARKNKERIRLVEKLTGTKKQYRCNKCGKIKGFDSNKVTLPCDDRFCGGKLVLLSTLEN